MRRTFAVAKRVLTQFKHDKRTLGIMLVAPCVVLWLFSVLLGAPTYAPTIAVVNVPNSYTEQLEKQDCTMTCTDTNSAQEMLSNGKADAVLSMTGKHTLKIEVEGADANKTAATVSVVRSALADMQSAAKTRLKSQVSDLEEKVDGIDFDIDQSVLDRLPQKTRDSIETAQDITKSIPDIDKEMPIQDTMTAWFHGSEDWTPFEFYGPVFIGIFVFVFVFLTSSMSLLTERSGGTIRRLIATPLKSWELVGGYLLGFGLLTLVQSAIILSVCIGLIGFPHEGSLGLTVLIVVSMALVSLTLGLLVSGLAHTPFQVVQLMIVFVVPQILLSGIFDLSQTPDWMQAIAALFPIGYGADALRNVMLRGADLGLIWMQLAALWGFIVVNFGLSCLNFRKARAKLRERSTH